DSATTGQDTAVTIDVLANDSDPNAGDVLTVDSVTQGASGSVTNNGSDVTYTPDAGFTGTDTFDYTVSDGNGGFDTATVTVTVNEMSDELISNVSVASGKTYEVDPSLAVGDVMFIDRGYEFTDVGSLAGAEYIRTANNDKNATDSDFLSFDVSQEVTVYLLYDNRITTLPSWLGDWTDTGEDVAGGAYPDGAGVYSKVFSAGTVTLGGNEFGGSMYGVAVVPTP
ncbi:MAG: hypothetical protein GVY16_12465, partial [Planctomycetes bacterium]|nr:hypothetical protein [Planctomycetota bacterium]